MKAENEKKSSSMLGSSIISTDAMHCRACYHQSMLWGWRSMGLCDHAAYMLHINKQTTFVDTLNAPAPRVGNSFRVGSPHALSSHQSSSSGLFFMVCLSSGVHCEVTLYNNVKAAMLVPSQHPLLAFLTLSLACGFATSSKCSF